MTAQAGVRVLRGPDWSGGETDGGEGHLGTVVEVLSGDRVRVLWDGSNLGVYKTGADGKFELRIFDTAPVGVRHPDTKCSACEEQNIYGMLWRCTSCSNCNLCSLCYVTDKHAIKHEFLRYNEPGTSGELVKKRSISLKIRAIGIFPGAKVKRGKDWAWADQDGGEGSIGEVIAFENVAPDSSRNIVRVMWPHDTTNSYRIGFQGNVDLVCVEEAAGTHYYRDHLPVLSTRKGSSSSQSTSDNAQLFAKTSSSPSSSSSSLGATASAGGKLSNESATYPQSGETTMDVGDKVVLKVDEEQLKELQAKYGGCTATMLKCIGKQGEVVAFAPNGAMAIKFEKINYRINPEAVAKVPSLSVGDRVRIRSDLKQVKLLNKRITWKSGMEKLLGKVGQVTKIDSDGDVVVSFGGAAYMFSPACCVPVDMATSFDSVTSCASDDNNSSNNSSTSASSNDSDDYGELHQDLMKFIAQMAGIDIRSTGSSGGHSGGRGGSGDAMDRLLRAIAKGDTNAARSLCQENKSLVNRKHKGITPLIMACHEGNKDMCSCLLAQGAEINLLGDKGNGPLHAAIEGKKEQIALFLLEKGANPNARNSKERNPVHLAAYNNLPELVKVLVQKGADPNAKDQFGDTPLHDAIDRDSKDAVDMLIRVKSIDLQAKNRKGFNMLQEAALKGNAHATERILARDSGHVDNLLDGKYSALHIAANNDHVDCVKLLVKNGNAEVNIVGVKKLRPLHMACMKGHVRSMEALVELGATVNVQDDDGDTPLHVTVGAKVDNPETLQGQIELKNRIRMACILLSKGAYPDIQNKKGAEPLRCCPYSGFRSAVEQFMKENSHLIKKCGSTSPRGGAGGLRREGTLDLSSLLQGMAMPCGAPGCMRRSDITLLPCGHKTLCRAHCLNVSECPLCDRTIERRIQKRSDTESEVIDACRQM